MNKSRRDFLKKLPLAMSIPFTLGGVSLRVMGQGTLRRLAAAAPDDGRVLIILQMHGGNDGLNCCIPVKDYNLYYNSRPNIAIPAANSLRKYVALDSTLNENSQIGLHPDMIAMKGLYDQGRMAVVQGVSYQNNNGSHFRGRDIWFMGGSFNDYYDSGWVGRYLQGEYAPYQYPDEFLNPLFPENTMKDPLAIELGTDVSLLFHQSGNIPTSFSLPPGDFESLEELEGFNEKADPRGIPPTGLEGSRYYKELEWILDLEDKTEDYTKTLLEKYTAGGKPSITYPTTYPFNAPQGSLRNPLSSQFDTIARLLAGGCKTKVFLAKIGGFDTHADQVEKYDSTMGGHAALLYHISTAVKAFQEDLRARGLEERVLTITTSEFSRRVKSNGSYGTDHGTAGPMFIFGKGVVPGVNGNAFETNASGDNLKMQYDYRNVYANIMIDWMKVPESRIPEIFPGVNGGPGLDPRNPSSTTTDGVSFEKMPLAQQVITGNEGFIGGRFALENCYPNPAKTKTTLHFRVNSAYQVFIDLYDTQGRKMKAMVDGIYEPGEHKIEVDLTGLPVGSYIYEMKTGFYKDSKKLVIVK
jgi:uncharacterized protein (DUF1501 family)